MKQPSVKTVVSTAKNVVGSKPGKHLIWLIPALVTMVTLVSFLGVCYAAVFQWMRTMKLERKALHAYLDSAGDRKPCPSGTSGGKEEAD